MLVSIYFHSQRRLKLVFPARDCIFCSIHLFCNSLATFKFNPVQQLCKPNEKTQAMLTLLENRRFQSNNQQIYRSRMININVFKKQ